MTFVIDSRLPSLNDYIDVCRKNKFLAAKFKQETEELIGWYILLAKNNGQIHPVNSPVTIDFVWVERTKKRDADNVAAAKKFILDALQKYGIIPNDSRKFVLGFSDRIIDGKSDQVQVTINEKGTPQKTERNF